MQVSQITFPTSHISQPQNEDFKICLSIANEAIHSKLKAWHSQKLKYISIPIWIWSLSSINIKMNLLSYPQTFPPLSLIIINMLSKLLKPIIVTHLPKSVIYQFLVISYSISRIYLSFFYFVNHQSNADSITKIYITEIMLTCPLWKTISGSAFPKLIFQNINRFNLQLPNLSKWTQLGIWKWTFKNKRSR